MFTIVKIYRKHLILPLWCIVVVCTLIHLQALPALAEDEDKTGEVQITYPQVNGMAVGRPGTKITITGQKFEGHSAINLYVTPNNDRDKCTPDDDPNSNGLLSLKTHPTVSAQGDGTFTVTTTWPDNASTPGTPYYICAIAQNVQAISSNSFTVAENTTVNVNPTSASPGDQVTISGTNWLPPQQLNVAIIGANDNTPVVSQITNPDQNGNFTVTLTLPGDTAAGSYTVAVTAPNEPTLQMAKSNALTVAEAATPTAEPSPTTQPTQASTPTPTSPSSGSSGSPNGLTFFAYGLGGVGIILIIVGIVMFVVYSRP